MTQTKLVLTQINQAAPEPVTPSDRSLGSDALVVILSLVYLLILVSTMLGVLTGAIKDSKEESRGTQLKISPPVGKIPCRSCRFFKDNHYLRCAVRPAIVMTKQAIDCSDYCPAKK